MTVWLLVPAVVSVAAFAVLVLLLRLVVRAVAGLRYELELFSATEVAGNELIRTAKVVGDHVERTHEAAIRMKKRFSVSGVGGSSSGLSGMPVGYSSHPLVSAVEDCTASAD